MKTRVLAVRHLITRKHKMAAQKSAGPRARAPALHVQKIDPEWELRRHSVQLTDPMSAVSYVTEQLGLV